MDNRELRLAVLIDADNIPYRNITHMLEEIAKYGTPTYKRIYGDWTSTRLSGWKGVLLENAIAPVQQYSYTSGKNATDSAMIIDAMDILYSKKVEGFCLVTSDSDFTRLAMRLREAGMKVIGMGEKKTPAAFKTACDKFIYIEVLHSAEEDEKNKNKLGKGKEANSIYKVDRKFKNLIRNSVNDLATEDGWAFLGALGNLLIKKQPEFDPRNYGFNKLLPLIKSLNDYQIDERDSGKDHIKNVYIKTKK